MWWSVGQGDGGAGGRNEQDAAARPGSDGTNFLLSNGANFRPGAGEIIKFVKRNDGKWIQTSTRRTLYTFQNYAGGTINAGATATVDVTLTASSVTPGLGDRISVHSFTADLGGLVTSCHWKSSGVVTIALYNPTASAIVLPSGGWRVWVDRVL